MTPTLIGLTIYILIREVMFFVERRDMLDRLMSKDLDQYKDNVKTEPNDFGKLTSLDELEEHKEDIINA